MKRFIQVFSIFIVFVVLLFACSNRINQTDTGHANDSVSETVQESQDEDESASPDISEEPQGKKETTLPENSDETTDETQTEDSQEPKSDAAVQEDGVIMDGKYVNRELGFSLNIPNHWMDHLAIGTGRWEGTVDHSVDFYYVADGEMNEFLFSILVYDHVIEENQWQEPVWKYIGTANGRTYACAIVGEPSEALLEEQNKDHFEYVKKLINEELLDVLDTIQYIDS